MPIIATQFESAGHRITERWWDYPEVPGYPSNTDSDELETDALRDFEGVVHADVLVLLNRGLSEGKAVETGIATALGKPVILVGTRSNIFHYMPNVHIVADVDAAISLLDSTL